MNHFLETPGISKEGVERARITVTAGTGIAREKLF